MSKIIRGIFNALKIIMIKIKCGNKVDIPLVQPFRINSELLIKKDIKTVKLGRRLKLECNARIRALEGCTLSIGNRCFFNCNTYLTCMGKTTIGDDCYFGPNVLIFDHDHDFRADGGVKAGKMKLGEIEIGNNVWIGGNCVILKGTKIGDNSVIGAGTIINGVIPPSTLIIANRENRLHHISHE